MSRLIALILASSLVGSVTLSAQKGKKQKDQPQKDKPQVARVNVVFTSPQRDSVRTYFVDTHGRGNCPPGLAKKNNGCLPPGQAKKRYAIGQPLPSTISLAELPRELTVRIGTVPAGYRYGVVDGDVIMLSINSRLVVDVIEGYIR